MADVIIFVWKPTEKSDVREIVIDKHKNGPTGIVNLFFNRRSVKFENFARGS